jgi:hypothetical protein
MDSLVVLVTPYLIIIQAYILSFLQGLLSGLGFF